MTAIRQSESMRTTDTDHDIVVFEAHLDVAACNTEKLMVAVAGASINAAYVGDSKITWLQAMEQLWELKVRILAVQFKPNFWQLVEQTRGAGYEFKCIAMDTLAVGEKQGVTPSFMFSIGHITKIKMSDAIRKVTMDEAGRFMEYKDIEGWPGSYKLAGRYVPAIDHTRYYWTKNWPVYGMAYQEAITNRQIAHPPPQPR